MTYEAYAAARAAILTGASRRIPAVSAASQARALGLWDGKNPAVGTEAQLGLLLDLGVFSPVGGHTPALEREARANPPPAGSDAARVMAGLHDTRLTLFRVAGPHPQGGVWIDDLLRGMAVHLRDDGLAREGMQGVGFGGRLMPIDGYEMTCGVLAPMLDAGIDLLLGYPLPPTPVPTAMPPLTVPDTADLATLREAAGMPDFVVRLYRAALDSGAMGPRRAG